MADLNVSMIGVNTERIQPRPTEETSVKAAEKLIELNKDESSRKEHIKEVLEDVISVSKDGDTAQASKNAKDKLEESKDIGDVKDITEKADAAKENAEKTKAKIAEDKARAEAAKRKEELLVKKEPAKPVANESKAKAKQSDVKSYDSYTDAQLRQMYIKGDISRYDYDHEISSRQENNDIKSSEAADEKVFREGIVRALKNENKAELSSSNIERAYEEDSNENMKAEQRMAMIDAADELTG